MQLDVEKYLPYLEGYDLTEEEKRAYIEELWKMMSLFVDRAWSDPEA